MKVIGINGSSRKDGNTAIIINQVFNELNKSGIETELIQLADYDILPCRGCFACKDRGNCVFTGELLLLLGNDTPQQIEMYYQFNRQGFCALLDQTTQHTII